MGRSLTQATGHDFFLTMFESRTLASRDHPGSVARIFVLSLFSPFRRPGFMASFERITRPSSKFSPFVLWLRGQARRPGVSRMVALKASIELWRNMTDQDKQPFRDESTRLVEAYREVLRAQHYKAVNAKVEEYKTKMRTSSKRPYRTSGKHDKAVKEALQAFHRAVRAALPAKPLRSQRGIQCGS